MGITVIALCGSSATSGDDFVMDIAEELSRNITTNHCGKQQLMGWRMERPNPATQEGESQAGARTDQPCK